MQPGITTLRRFALLLASIASYMQARAQTELQTTASNVRMTVNNIGLIGNAFRGSYFSSLGYKSCEYPAGSGVEHLFQGGLWVGTRSSSNVFHVTTGAIDASGGYTPGGCNFEFTTTPNAPLRQISSLVRDPNYNPLAISHQDFIADYTDANTTLPGTNIMVDRSCAGTNEQSLSHTPLHLNVHLETYNYNYSFANFFVILNYTITNTGTTPLENIAIGQWADGVVRNVRHSPPSGGTPFFDKGGNGYMDSLYMGYEFDATGDTGFTESYIGIKYLGATYLGKRADLSPDSTVFYSPCNRLPFDTNFGVYYNTWQFNSPNPFFHTPTSEPERYGRLTTGLNYAVNWNKDTLGLLGLRDQIRLPSNRSNLVSVGPLGYLAPGQSINIAFAVVLARKVEDGHPNVDDTPAQKALLAANADWAQTTYNGEDKNCNGILDAGEDQNLDGLLTRYVLPAPPDVPLARVEVGQTSAMLYWSDNSERSVDPITRKMDFAGYRIYKTRTTFDLASIVDLGAKLELYKTYAKPSPQPYINPIPTKGSYMFEGDTVTYRYKLEIPNLPSGWQHVLSITAYDSGNVATNLQPLESSQLEDVFRVFPGTPANQAPKDNAPFAYPNPYYGQAAWERAGSQPQEHRLVFANLPGRCRVRILSQAGDLIDEFTHEAVDYRGQDNGWFKLNSDPATNQLSGGEHTWDLLSKNNQIIARGVYLFSVEDLADGRVYKGRFTVIK